MTGIIILPAWAVMVDNSASAVPVAIGASRSNPILQKPLIIRQQNEQAIQASGNVVSFQGADGTKTIQGMKDPDGDVRVIIQLHEAPVAVFKTRLKAIKGAMANSFVNQVQAYSGGLQRNHQGLVNAAQSQSISLSPTRKYIYVLNGMTALVKQRDVEKLKALPQVRAVYRDEKVHALLTESVPLIGAPQVWAMVDGQGKSVSGQGVTVAVIDTGIDYTHPDLGGGFGPGYKVVGGYDFVNNDNDPMDDHGHGTHCAGIVAANGVLKGVAPGAKLYAIKVLDSGGSGWNSDVIAGIEWAMDPDGNPATDDAADIISLSLGGSGNPDDPTCQAVDVAAGQGVLAVIAAGNSGPNYGSLGSPGVARQALTVGATDKSDALAYFSSLGPVDGYFDLIKPDIVAPGVYINSTAPVSGVLGSPTRYRVLSGTSMATPHVAGSAALLKQMHPDWTPAQIKSRLMNTTLSLTDLNCYQQGAGRVRVNQAAQTGSLLTPASLGFGVVDLDVSVWSSNRNVRLTNVSGGSKSYTLQVTGSLPPGATVNLNPSTVTLGAWQSADILVAVSVNNTVTPIMTNPPNAYEGRITAQTAEETISVPFSFIQCTSLIISFDEDPWMVLIHGPGWVAGRIYPGTVSACLVPPGIYDIIVTYDDGGNISRVVKEHIPVTSVTHVAVAKNEACHSITADLQMQVKPLALECKLTHKQSGLYTYTSGEYSDKISDLSANYVYDVRMNLSPLTNRSAVYDVLLGLTNGIYSDHVFQLQSSDFSHLNYRFAYPSNATNMMSLHLLSFSGRYSYGDMLFREYYITPKPRADFSLSDQFQDEVYVNGEWGGSWEGHIKTPFLRAVAPQKIEVMWGLSIWGSSAILTIDSGGEVRWGCAPPHWFGCFSNQTESMYAYTTPFVPCYFPFQNQDVFNPFQNQNVFNQYNDLPFALYKDQVLITNGVLSSPCIVSLPSPGQYRLIVPYTNYTIRGQAGLAVVTAVFNTSANDKNPPFIRSLQILNDSHVTDIVPLGGMHNEIQFSIEDDSALNQVVLYYSLNNGETWLPLPLSHNGNVYTTQAPTLSSPAFVALKLTANDDTGNELIYELYPAFWMGNLPPETPSGATIDEARLSWNAVNGATSYEIWRNYPVEGDGIKPYVIAKAGETSATYYDDVDYNEGMVYSYWIRAKNSDGASDFTDGIPGTSFVPAPTGVSASDGTFTDKVHVTWNASSGATSYEVWRHTSNNSSSAAKISSPDPTGTSYDDTSATAGTNYYWVKAVNAAGASSFSASDSGYWLAPPNAPTVMPPTNGTINAFWANWQTASSATNYWLDVAPTDNFATYLAGYSNRMIGAKLTCIVTGLQAKTEYYYRVRAENGVGMSANSGTQTVSTAAMALSVSSLNYTGVYSGTPPAAQGFMITNLGARGFEFTNTATYSSGASGWWTPTPRTGSVNGLAGTVITGSVSLTGVNAGTYYATNTVISADATNSPQTFVATLTVNKANQAIANFTPASGSIFPIPTTVVLAAQANSGLPVTFELVSGPGKLDGASLTFTNAGLVRVKTLQAGDTNYLAAPSLTNIYNKLAATVTLGNLTQVYDGTSKTVTSITVPAGLTVDITYNGSATTPVNVGNYAVVATINDATYQGSTDGTLVVAKANQAITFPAIPNQEVASVVTLSATASSGLTVSYSSTGPAVLNGNTLSFTGAGTVSIVASQVGNANWNAAANVTRNVTVNANPPPSAPTGISATDGTYTDKIQVTWNAAGDATGYQVWRSMSNNAAIASNLVTTATTTCDDLTAATTPGTILYYWVKAVNAGGASGFSTNDTGYVKPAIGPTIKANGTVGDVTVNYPDTMAITIEMNEDPYAGAPVDWWVLSLAGSSWYYLNNLIQWTQFDGNLANCHPLYQGGSLNLPAYLLPTLNIPGLPISSYTFWFAVDAQKDGVLNLDEQLLADSVNVTLASASPAPCIKANGATGIVTVNYPDAMVITVELDARAYAGVPADWWVLLNAGSAWFYLDSAVGWTQGVWSPVLQGALGNLPAIEVLNIAGLGAGSYTFYFAVDLPMNGILNMEQIWVDAVTVNVQ